MTVFAVRVISVLLTVFRHSMRISLGASSGLLGVAWKTLKWTGVPGVMPVTSWNAPANELGVLAMLRWRFFRPLCGPELSVAALAVPDPLKPSQMPVNG